MYIVHFKSGKSREIDNDDYDKLLTEMGYATSHPLPFVTHNKITIDIRSIEFIEPYTKYNK